MTEIFLPGPLGSAGALAAMIGAGEPQVSAVIAVLDGHRLHVDPDGLRLVPVPAPGSRIHGRLVAAAFSYFGDTGRLAAHNRPYAGGFVLDRHASQRGGIHAIQLEICRDLYLDSDHVDPADGLAGVVATVSRLVRVLAGEAADMGRSGQIPLAAE